MLEQLSISQVLAPPQAVRLEKPQKGPSPSLAYMARLDWTEGRSLNPTYMARLAQPWRGQVITLAYMVDLTDQGRNFAWKGPLPD